jgi:hypothetical protein
MVSGLAHKPTGGRTFLIRQWRRVRVDNAAALMQRDELDVAQRAVEELPGRLWVLRRFNPTGGSLCKENACPDVHHVPHVITNIIARPIMIKTATVPSMLPIHDQHLSALSMTRSLTPGSSTSRKTWHRGRGTLFAHMKRLPRCEPARVRMPPRPSHLRWSRISFPPTLSLSFIFEMDFLPMSCPTLPLSATKRRTTDYIPVIGRSLPLGISSVLIVEGACSLPTTFIRWFTGLPALEQRSGLTRSCSYLYEERHHWSCPTADPNPSRAPFPSASSQH